MEVIKKYSIAIIAVILFLFWQVNSFMGREAVLESDKASTSASGTVQIGGDFVLTDHHGKSFDTRSLRGKYQLVYFGYSFCPDICPASLAVITAGLNQLDETIAKQITPVFVTVDPVRDDVAIMKEYVDHFHPSFIGLTGAQEDVAKAAAAYRIYYKARKENEGDADYLVDHSGYVYLMDKQGKYVTHFSHDVTASHLVTKIKEIIQVGKE